MRAGDKINLLINEGCNIRCVHYNNEEFLPEWFDKKKFTRGQKFFQEFIFVHFLMKMSGFLYVLSVKKMYNFLKYTGNTNTSGKINKRFLSTIYHMCVWYHEDFTPNSTLWQSLVYVRKKHFNSDKLVCKIDSTNFMSQKDVAFTQFAFMGLILMNPGLISIYPDRTKDIEAFIHVWRVIGYLLGIEDRYNFCDGSVEDVTECCWILSKEYINNYFHKIDDDYKKFVKNFIRGMSSFLPYLSYNVNLKFICRLCKINTGDIKFFDNNKSLYDKFLLIMYNCVCFFYKYRMIRFFINLFFYRLSLKNVYKIQ